MHICIYNIPPFCSQENYSNNSLVMNVLCILKTSKKLDLLVYYSNIQHYVFFLSNIIDIIHLILRAFK